MNKPARPGGSLVYSTDGGGRMCPSCRRPVAACVCSFQSVATPPSQGDGIVRVGREIKGRAGKGVTVVRGLPIDAAALATLAKQLKAACGAGGTVKDSAIEIQGEQREAVAAWLRKQGWTVRIGGG